MGNVRHGVPSGWGIAVANELTVDSEGLRCAAAGSDAAAAALDGTTCAAPSDAWPSSAGIDLLNTALAEVRVRQSNWITGQANGMSVAGTQYADIDAEGGRALTVTV